ncbi:H-2 class II histocompatibility antigen, A-U alpha chain-like [Scleropages formosus]|uniref:H-2 class II histocompatibility antigen, A-U alpha chain-like n=1 Tax=Scleropages formosus TaxID=113540 RepID=UPI0010FAA3AB|nr:H-2 class II histocompatibility antigen, A-U alpha chain-like [Scleropages formosus]
MSHPLIIALLLGAVLGVCSQVQVYVDMHVVACHTNDMDPEDEKQLDGNEMYYLDFKKKDVVITKPPSLGQFSVPLWVQYALLMHKVCLYNLYVAVEAENYPPEQIDPPEVIVYPRNKVLLGRRNKLICFVNNFFPPPVKVKWTKNDVEVTEGVTLSRYYPNKDFTFRQYSTVPITPQEGDVYSCTVEHNGLPEPETRFWEPEIREVSDIGKTVYCGAGLTLGLLGVGVGTFFLVKGISCN